MHRLAWQEDGHQDSYADSPRPYEDYYKASTPLACAEYSSTRPSHSGVARFSRLRSFCLDLASLRQVVTEGEFSTAEQLDALLVHLKREFYT